MKKLRLNSHIRVLSPSSSIARLGGLSANLSAKAKLEELGFRISFSEHYEESDLVQSASIASRVADLHQAFADPSVDAILATIGGFNSNELLPYLDYELIAQTQKIICGYSDSTAFLNAIFAQTGMKTYMGPSFSSFKMVEGQDYQSSMWLQAMTQTHYELVPSKEWSSDPWYDPSQPRQFFPTEWKTYTPGQATGTIIGGNLSTFVLLQGTPYAPKVKDYILFVEEAEVDDYIEFMRHLASLLQAYPEPQALVIGRFPKECQMTEELLHFILDKHPILQTIPVLYDLDFAHTQPLFTITIGAQATLDTSDGEILVKE
ncbi:S66 family peptidase [Streptococcus moroccensis]|uniref:Muramoyltetrapeptide carboxypeptidase LdcA involved in peptidoglycan recycling n=1 Tax=Streptococcus moroccensis TaxID=1451356 RepID=A0ABT9YPV5_9STRE|nr:S66 peptidase family protein [Streptococcus moroccensis]MDQ0222025.1 muramoyltetrapeptide carboxypeptidase LdcA involved in peptidoglycan recycling [Streptococcus moroccensis]